MNVPIISLKIIFGGKQKKEKNFSLDCHAIVSPEVFSKLKNAPNLFSAEDSPQTPMGELTMLTQTPNRLGKFLTPHPTRRLWRLILSAYDPSTFAPTPLGPQY